MKIDLVLQGPYTNYTQEAAEHYLNLDFVNRIIISCWKADPNPQSSSKIVIIKSDPIHPGLGNRNLQIKTSLEGLKLVETEFSVKLRSDQKISLESMKMMYDFYNLHKEQELCFVDGSKPKNKICVAGMFKHFPFHPRDHLFWGNTEDLINVFNIPYEQLSDDEILILTDESIYLKYLRTEIYICQFYYAKFDNDIIRFIKEPLKYLVDSASNISESFEKSYLIRELVFKSFPKIEVEWLKYGITKDNYDFGESIYGQYWNEELLQID